MFKVEIINNSQITHSARFLSIDEINNWIAKEDLVESFGKPQRWVLDTEENNLTQSEKDNALQVRDILKWDDTVIKEYELPANYEVQITDITADVQKEETLNKLSLSIQFGNDLIKSITIENMMMGITQDGMTSQVRKAMGEALMALMTGSLYDAIDELKAIPEDKKDGKYITDARLLAAINKIETFLGKPKSISLN